MKTTTSRPLAGFCCAALICSLLAGCEPSNQSTASPTSSSSSLTLSPASDNGYQSNFNSQSWWLQGGIRSEQTLTAATALKESLAALATTPSPQTLEQTRQEWLNTHQRLVQLTPWQLLAKMQPGLFGSLSENWPLLDQWPIQPGYLDSYDVYLHSGIVNDISVPINAAAIRQQNGLTDPQEVTLGLHAMAYLLWGEDSQRTPEAFIPKSPVNISDDSNHRRMTLLQLQAELLIDELNTLNQRLNHQASAANSAYRALSVSQQQQLWQQVITVQLQQLLKRLNQLSVCLGEEECERHAAFAELSEGKVMALELGSLQPLFNQLTGNTEATEPFQQLKQALLGLTDTDSTTAITAANLCQQLLAQVGN
jgi:putative iron-regulated protein